MKLGTGNIVGLPGQTLQILVDDIEFALRAEPGLRQQRPLHPQQNTPFEHVPHGDLNLTLNTMALWRILLGPRSFPRSARWRSSSRAASC